MKTNPRPRSTSWWPALPLLGTLLTASAAALLAPPAQAAPTLNGGWAPFNRCAVDDPTMLENDGVTTQSICVASDSPGGSLAIGSMGVIQLGPIAIGNAPATAGHSNVQFGASVPVGTFSGIDAIVPPAAGAVLADPAEVPGGLLGLLCTSHNLLIAPLCRLITNNDLNRVLATLESAGVPSGFDLFAALQTGVPIMNLPVKIHLQHPFLGSNCYIGSDQDPIVLRPQNAVAGTPSGNYYRLDGTPAAYPEGVLNRLDVVGATQVDDSFTVPRASGCGFGDPFTAAAINSIINAKIGLPAAAGRNHLQLDDASASILLPTSIDLPVSGQAFADGWASAIVSP